ncbi:hypothetical protein U1Q18_019093 [Sarracenia purpurea var. burkii]
METKFAKMLDSGRQVVVGLKRKQATRCEAYFTDATDKALPAQTTLNSSINELRKRRKIRFKSTCVGCASHFKKSLVQCYSNFSKSGVPQRLMFYQNGEWRDFPQDLFGMIKQDLQVKKAATEVEFNGHLFLVDFLHMIRLDLKTGLQLPIAWIDEAGKCFFPEILADDDELHHCCHHVFVNDQENLFLEPQEYPNVRLGIEVNGSDCFKLKEDGEAVNMLNKKSQVEKSDDTHCDAEDVDSCVGAFDPHVDTAIGRKQQLEKKMVTSVAAMHGAMDSDAVRKMFLVGMGSYAVADTVEIYRGSSSSMQARLELFLKQAEITERFRGDANVQYAWLPTTKEAVSNILMYGLGKCETSKSKSTHGIGVHLSPANCIITSASYCEIDENGVRHMVFCRVVMGKMELVHAGSKQFHPSSEDFDSGVDNLQYPRQYIVWNMNKNTHIYPEYVVSFKASSDAEGFLVGSKNKLDISDVTTCSQGPPQFQLQLDRSPSQSGIYCHQVPVEKLQEKTANLGSCTERSAKMPWMPFRVLFAALSSKIPTYAMKAVESNYDLFKRGKIKRDDFVRTLRLMAGDTLLMSTIKDIRSKENDKLLAGNDANQGREKNESSLNQVMSESKNELVAPKLEEESSDDL